jgi:predicted dehydrogenase
MRGVYLLERHSHLLAAAADRGHLPGYRAMFRDFLAALRTGREPLMTLARAQRGLELIEAAYRTVSPAPELETIS